MRGSTRTRTEFVRFALSKYSPRRPVPDDGLGGPPCCPPPGPPGPGWVPPPPPHAIAKSAVETPTSFHKKFRRMWPPTPGDHRKRLTFPETGRLRPTSVGTRDFRDPEVKLSPGCARTPASPR